MYEKDYLMRYLLHFLEKIVLLLSKNKFIETDITMVADWYEEIFQQSRISMIHKDKAELIENQQEECHLEKMRLLAELFYLEARMCDAEVVEEFLDKSLFIFEYVHRKIPTFDLNLQERIYTIQRLLNKQ